MLNKIQKIQPTVNKLVKASQDLGKLKINEVVDYISTDSDIIENLAMLKAQLEVILSLSKDRPISKGLTI